MSKNPPAENAVIKTAYGDMVIEFWPEVAPKTVENFKKLAKSGFYDGTAFHRIIKGFMIHTYQKDYEFRVDKKTAVLINDDIKCLRKY